MKYDKPWSLFILLPFSFFLLTFIFRSEHFYLTCPDDISNMIKMHPVLRITIRVDIVSAIIHVNHSRDAVRSATMQTDQVVA